MSEMIWLGNAAYDKYVELIRERDRMKKIAFQMNQEYIRTFGELILSVFRKKLECIRKKKMIAFCQAAINRGEVVDQAALQAYLTKEMEEYRKQLDDMIRENENARSGGEITQYELLKIKKIYHRIAKRIHPDIFPKTNEEPVLKELWNRAVAAYECNDLEGLTECEMLVNKALDEMGLDMEISEIPDIEEKIISLKAQIKKICETDPYQYKYLLEDPEAVEAKKESLAEELKSYEDYDRQLEDMLAEIMGNGGVIAWQMN